MSAPLPSYPAPAAPLPVGPPAWQPLPHHPRATLALALGITSVTGLLLVVPLLLGPLAWYHGVSTMRAIDREPARWGGRGSATAGLVTGIVATAALAFGLLVLLLVTAIALALGSIDVGYGS